MAGLGGASTSVAAAHDNERSELVVVGPKDALRLARPLPPDEKMQIEGLTKEVPDAFIAALDG